MRGLTFPLTIFFLTLVVFRPLGVLAASPILRLQTEATPVAGVEEFAIEIYLDPIAQETVGTDVILNFEAAFLEVRRIECGHLYPNCPARIYDNEKGMVKVAGSANYSQYENGYSQDKRILATIFFKAKKAGKTTIDFNWAKEETKETNVVSPEKKDILTSRPEGLELEIQASSSQTASSQTEVLSAASANPSYPPSPGSIAGLVSSQATPQKPSLVQGITKTIEKIVEKVVPKRQEFLTPLAEPTTQILGSREPPLGQIPIFLYLSVIMFALIFLAVFLTKRLLARSRIGKKNFLLKDPSF